MLIVVPIGSPKIEYNAHRIYSYEQVISYFTNDDIYLQEFAFIPEYEKDGGIIRDADPKLAQNAHYACGCFWFKKK